MYRTLAIACLCAAGVARADSLVCKAKIIETGISSTELLAACGEPTSKTIEKVDVLGPRAHGTVKVADATVETWRYERGNRKLASVVVVRDGKVFSIRYE